MSLSTNSRDGRTAPSLLAVGIALALFPNLSQAAGAAEDTIIVEGSSDSASDTQEQDYSVRTTSAGTKMEMAQRDIPQSVSIITGQRMQDQQLQTLGDVMEHTMGISGSQADSDRTSYYSRGFEIDNYMVDGIPTWFESRWNLGDALSDMALFERVEVVRGANGLLTG
ncbi:MAG: TonB-dependent receptor plug domain-containing protein, partial [Klebsiella grimontii]|nr:TonB-dependent receptor plug domain-containing protein [Klebsiella grimontii]